MILRNSFADDENGVKEKILAYCSEARTKDEISELLNMSKNYVMTKYVKPLLKENKLKLTIPNKPNSPFQKYIKN